MNFLNKKRKTKASLSKKEQREIEKRLSILKKQNKNNLSSTQSVIAYEAIFPNGLCHIKNNLYSLTIQFDDCNYRLVDLDDKTSIFSRWCELHNYMDCKFQFSYENQSENIDDSIAKIHIADQSDEYNDIRQEYNQIRIEALNKAKISERFKKYLTIQIEAKNRKIAYTKLSELSNEIIKLFSAFNVNSKILNGAERLEVFFRTLNPYSTEPFIFDWDLKMKMGYSTKDFIAPNSFKFKKNEFEVNDCYGMVTGINIFASELSDNVLTDFLRNIDGLLSFNLHIEPVEQAKALKLIRSKLTDVEKMKIDEQKKASQNGYDTDILPPAIKTYIENLTKMLEDLQSKNERLFNVTMLVKTVAKSKKQKSMQLDSLKRLAQKNGCKIFTLDYMQEQGFVASLPLGLNEIPIYRCLPTSSTGGFIPFSTQEIFQVGGQYYGLNAVSKNMILADRKKLKNPNGLFLGTPGSGKSFSIKREIVDNFLTSDNYIFITDPEGEYYPLVDALNGQVVEIKSTGSQFINPMDIVIEQTPSENHIADQSDFLISLCEIIVGGAGLEAVEISAIDKCVRRLYKEFLENPSVEKMPILADLQKEMEKEDVHRTLSRVRNSLDMYTNGSQSLFNHQTNVDLNNRIVCYDIKSLGTQLKKVAMLIIQNQVWNRVSINRNENKSTNYYIDEFHLLLRDEQTAKYSVEIWKRFRKWGGIPTGITQNVKDLLSSPEIENIFDNSDFVYMLNQSAGDRFILQEKLNIPNSLISYVTNSDVGNGLLFFGNIILPFKDDFPTDTKLFQLMNTNPELKNKGD